MKKANTLFPVDVKKIRDALETYNGAYTARGRFFTTASFRNNMGKPEISVQNHAIIGVNKFFGKKLQEDGFVFVCGYLFVMVNNTLVIYKKTEKPVEDKKSESVEADRW